MADSFAADPGHGSANAARGGPRRAGLVLAGMLLIALGLAACGGSDGLAVDDAADDAQDEVDPFSDAEAGEQAQDEPEPQPEPEPEPEPESQSESQPESESESEQAGDAASERLWAEAEAAADLVRLPEPATLELARADEPGVVEGSLEPGVSYAEARQFFDEVFDSPEWDQIQQGSGGSDEEQFAIWEVRGYEVEVRLEMTGHGPPDTTDIDGVLRITSLR